MFRKFDRRNKGAVSFSDFAYGIEDLGLKFERELIMQLFAHLDRDQDGQLKHADFIFLC